MQKQKHNDKTSNAKVAAGSLFGFLSTSVHSIIHIQTYVKLYQKIVHMCVCVCVCVGGGGYL